MSVLVNVTGICDWKPIVFVDYALSVPRDFTASSTTMYLIREASAPGLLIDAGGGVQDWLILLRSSLIGLVVVAVMMRLICFGALCASPDAVSMYMSPAIRNLIDI
jgi:hypothetical protein